MNETEGLYGLSEENFHQEAGDLEAQGYRRVSPHTKLKPGQYFYTTFSGDQHDFGEDIQYNIKWMSF